MENKDIALIGALSVLLTGIVINLPLVRSRLKTPMKRALVAGLLAAVLALGGLFIRRLLFHAG